MELKSRNVPQALPAAISTVLCHGEQRDSRNGPVIAMDEPFTLTYERPDERVLFLPEREANPFFHLYECLWMMAGRRDVGSVANYVAGMRNYSDDGRIFNGAYGHRWRKNFNVDQLRYAVERLSQDGSSEDRRTYMAMWDPRKDTKPSLDLPCNVGVSFRVRSDGKLDMTVFNRSNDLIWGTLGANAVHMSFLHELVARATGLPLGRYHQVSNDTHIYKDKLEDWCYNLADGKLPNIDLYEAGAVQPHPIMEVPFDTWMEDLDLFMRYGVVVGIRDRFFRRVAGPITMAHLHYRTHKGLERYDGALEIMDQCTASDWRVACTEWLLRRRERWLEKAS